jgi:hypothetical protein
MGASARTKDLEDETRTVDHLRLPTALEIALLNRRQRAVDDDQPDLLLRDLGPERVDAAAADQRARNRTRETNDVTADDIEADRLGKPDRLVETSIERTGDTTIGRPVARRRFQSGMDDKGTARCRRQNRGGTAQG